MIVGSRSGLAKMYFTYILYSLINNQYYIGCTNNLNDRIKRHNSGKVRSTKSYKPWKLVYKEAYNTLSEARKRESQIKSWHKRATIEKLINGLIV